MAILADLHVHIYPDYSVSKAFSLLSDKIKTNSLLLSKGDTLIIALTEKLDCCFFQDLLKQELLPKEYQRIQANPDFIYYRIHQHDLLIFAGYQCNTSEKIECLSLFSSVKPLDKKPLTETIENIQKNQGTAVINWAPGKWLFRRGKRIREFLQTPPSTDAYQPEKIYLGDTSLRPLCFPLPKIMQQFSQHKIIYGSDPLPDQREESNLFKYYTKFEGDLDLKQALQSIRILIQQKQGTACGKRSSLFELLIRQYRLYKQKA